MKTIGISIALGATVQGSIGSAFKTIDEKSRAISKSLKGIELNKKLSVNLLKANKEFTQLKRAQKKAGGASVQLKKKIYAAAESLKKAKEEAKEYGISLKNVSKQQKLFQKYETLQTKNAFDYSKLRDNKYYRDRAKGQMLDKLAIGMVAVTPFKFGIEFESSMARVKALSGATKEEFERLNDTAKKLGASTTFSATEVGQGMQYLAMAGFKANETIKAMPGLLNLASAGQTDLATTSDIASDILSGFGLKAKDMGKVSDILAKTFTTANTDLGKLGETMKYVGPVARKAGMSLEETSAMAGLLGNVGIKASEAGTVLRKMVLSLSAPNSAASKSLQKLGIATKDAHGNMRDMVKILGDVADATKNMGSGDQLAVYKNIFGEEAAAGVAELISKEGSKGVTKYLDVIKNYQGTASRIAKQQNDTVAGSFKAFGSALEGVSISVSSLFLPALKTVTLGITSLTQGLNSFIQNHKTVATIIGGIGGGMIALSVSAFALRYAFSFVSDGFLAIRTGIRSAIFWMSAEGRMLALNRVQLIATALKTKTLALWQGIVATKTKVMTLWTTRSTLAQKGAALWKGVVAIKTKALAFWQGVIVTKTKSLALWTARSTLAQKSAAIASGAFSFALKAVGIAFRFALGPVGLVITGLGLVTAGVVWAYHKFDWFKNGVNIAWGVIKKVFSFSPFGMVTKIWGKVFDWLGSRFAWFGKAVDKLKSIGSGIADFLGFGEDKKLEVGKTVRHIAVGTAMTAQLATAAPTPVTPKPAMAKPVVTKPAIIKTVTPKLAMAKPVVTKPVSNISQVKQIHSVQNKYNNVSQTMQKKQSSASHHTYNITVQVQSGNPKDIANEVKKTIAQMESSRKNRSFSDEEI